MSSSGNSSGTSTNENDYYSQFDDDRNTKLHYDASHNDILEVQKTLETGEVKVDAENFLGWTPLMMAARNGNLEVVKLLIEHKADATKRNFYGSSVFLMAIAVGNMELIHFILQHLLQGGVSKQSMEIIMSPITVALVFEQDHILEYLITNTFNVNSAAPITRITPIMISAMLNKEALFQMLISKGADPFIKNLNDESAYEIMCSKKPRKRPSNARSQQQRNPNSNVNLSLNSSQHLSPILDLNPMLNPILNPMLNPMLNPKVNPNLNLTPNFSLSHNVHHNPNPTHNPNHSHNHHQSHGHLCSQPHQPLFLSPQCHNKPVQVIYLTPPANFCNPLPSNHHPPFAKSSNTATPPYFMLPPVSPIAPMFSQQVFFPQNFNPNAHLSPANSCQLCTYDDLFCGKHNGQFMSSPYEQMNDD